MNRALSRRTFSETTRDMRRFLTLLALEVRRGVIEVHAYVVMLTHFHLLVRSLTGELPQALRRIQLDYVRYFNRSRRRDGPLVRNRFRSKPVTSLAYRSLLVGYIDANPVRAGIVQAPHQYPFGSAARYARADGPPWLCRGWVEAVVCESVGLSEYDPAYYPQVFGRQIGAEHEQLVMAPPADPRADLDLDALIRGSLDVREWMIRKAELADGTRPGAPVVLPSIVDGAVREGRVRFGDWLDTGARGPRRDLWRQARCLLLRDLAGLEMAQIAARCGCGESTVRRDLRRARALVVEDTEFAVRIEELTRSSLDACYGRVAIT